MMALALMLSASGCKKHIPISSPAAAAESKSAVPSPLTVRAVTLGFAAHLPADTAAYFGTLNLPAHAAALKETNYFKDLTAFLDDKTPAPASGNAKKSEKPVPFEKLLGDDFFFSLGKGAAKAISSLQQLSSFYTEMTYRSLMAGATPGAKPGAGGTEQMLNTLLNDPELLKRATAALTDAQLPPIMVGVHTDRPDEVLKELLPDDLLAQVRKTAKVSQVTTSLGGKFTLIEATGKDLFNDDMKKKWLAGLPAECAAALPEIGKAVAVLQAKRITLAYGTAGGYLIVMLGSERPNLEFATNPAASLLSRPEFGVLAPYESKNLAAVFFAEGGTLQSLQTPEPLQPMARGVLGALKQSPMFAGMAATLEGKVAALGPVEHELYDRPMTTMIGAAWWDKGLHLEVEGGLSPKGLESGKPLKFASLVEDPNAVLALNFHGDPQTSATLRRYVEGWAEVLHVAGQELAKANMFGDQGPKMADWIDKEVVPPLVTFYKNSKTLYTQALGNEQAWIVDLGGTMPHGLTPVQPAKEESRMVRIVGVHDVVDRRLIGDSWEEMNAALNGVAKAFPMLAGAKLPEPDVSNNAGVISYSYPLPMGSDDLLPCTSVSDKLFMLGTSKIQQQDIAARLLRAAPGTGTPTMLWRLDGTKLREALKSFAPAGPAGDNAKAAVKWLAPLGEARGRLWIESGRVRNSISLEMKDTTKFD